MLVIEILHGAEVGRDHGAYVELVGRDRSVLDRHGLPEVEFAGERPLDADHFQ